jgi:hypothetical protein
VRSAFLVLCAALACLALPSAAPGQKAPRRPRLTVEGAEPRAKKDRQWPIRWEVESEPASCRSTYDPAQGKDVPANFREGPACFLLRNVTYLLEHNGPGRVITHEVIRCNDWWGVDSFRQHREIVWEDDDAIALHLARAHKAGGGTVEVRPEHLHVLRPGALRTRERDLGENIILPVKQLLLFFPNLEPGDVIEVKWSRSGKLRDDLFACNHRFGAAGHPCVRSELRLRLPKERQIKHAAVAGAPAPEVTVEGGYRVHSWCVRDWLAAWDEGARPRVVCSEFRSWEQVGRWYRSLQADRQSCPPRLRQLVRELTRDSQSDLDKARALTAWVRQHVRYTSVGHGHGCQPHPPGRTFDDRFGDCKDMSHLLVVLLRQAGVQAAFAAIGTGPEHQPVEDVPLPTFNHAIVVVILDGQRHWVDPTFSDAREWDELPGIEHDRLCCVLDGDAVRMLRTPPPPAPPATGSVERLRERLRQVRFGFWQGLLAGPILLGALVIIARRLRPRPASAPSAH